MNWRRSVSCCFDSSLQTVATSIGSPECHQWWHKEVPLLGVVSAGRETPLHQYQGVFQQLPRASGRRGGGGRTRRRMRRGGEEEEEEKEEPKERRRRMK